jgi:PD-(D/E)XK nuclease superfamily
MPTIPYKNKEGKRVSGVTSILSANLGWNKQPLMYWAWNEGMEGRNFRETAEKAADGGTVGHYLIDCDIRKTIPDLKKFPKEAIDLGETCYLNFLEWKKMVDFRPVHTEIHLVSEQYQFGATPDCIGTVIDKTALVDWKTGGTYEDHLLQLSAYRVAWEENNPDQPLTGGFHLLRIGKEDASFHHHHWDSLPEAWEAFRAVLKLHEIHKKLKKSI